MGSQRTSNKDIADKLDTLIELMTAQAVAAQSAAPAATVVAEPAQPTESKIRISQSYLRRMVPKWQKMADSKAETVVGYAYHKRNGKLGLWGCLKSDWSDVSRRDGTIGAVQEVHPS